MRETLADYAHAAWSGWMKHLFSKCEPHEVRTEIGERATGSLIIPKSFVERWTRQIETPYAELPENEKESDRKEADRMLELVQLKNLLATLDRLTTSETDLLEHIADIRQIYEGHKLASEELANDPDVNEHVNIPARMRMAAAALKKLRANVANFKFGYCPEHGGSASENYANKPERCPRCMQRKIRHLQRELDARRCESCGEK